MLAFILTYCVVVQQKGHRKPHSPEVITVADAKNLRGRLDDNIEEGKARAETLDVDGLGF